MKGQVPNSEQIELLNKYLTGDANKNEVLKAEELISSDEVCKKYWEEILYLHESILAPKIAQNIDVKKAYTVFLENTKEKTKSAKDKDSTNRKAYINILKIAAALIIILSTWRLNYYFTKEKLQVFSSNQKQDQSIALLDGSLIELNKNTIVKYPKKFKKDSRTIYFQGEAYFNIIDKPNNPFIIKIEDYEVNVVGTAFNLYAYPEKEIIEVSVDTGNVNVYNINKKEATVLKINAREKVTISKKKEKITKEKINNFNHKAWKTGIIEFKEAPLFEVIETLNKTYNISIIIENEELNNCKLTANFNNRPISFIFEILKLNFDIEIIQEGDKYIITGEKCKNTYDSLL